RRKKRSTESAPPTAIGEAATDSPLNPDEAAELKRNLRLISEHRSTLSLELTETEELLVSGEREPTHRGVCQHVLDKVREEDVLRGSGELAREARLAVLAEAIRFRPHPSVFGAFVNAAFAAGTTYGLGDLFTPLRRLGNGPIAAADATDLVN